MLRGRNGLLPEERMAISSKMMVNYLPIDMALYFTRHESSSRAP